MGNHLRRSTASLLGIALFAGCGQTAHRASTPTTTALHTPRPTTQVAGRPTTVPTTTVPIDGANFVLDACRQFDSFTVLVGAHGEAAADALGQISGIQSDLSVAEAHGGGASATSLLSSMNALAAFIQSSGWTQTATDVNSPDVRQVTAACQPVLATGSG